MPAMHPHLETVRALCRNGKFQEAEDYWYAELKKTGCCDEWVNPFQPAGQINIRHRCGTPFSDYSRSLDFTTGLGTVEWREGDEKPFVNTDTKIKAIKIGLEISRQKDTLVVIHEKEHRLFRANGQPEIPFPFPFGARETLAQ